MTQDDRTHRAVVERLTHDLRPVRRPWSPWIRLALWVVLALGTVTLAAGVGLRHDLPVELERPRYALTLMVLLAGAGLAATAALLDAIPARFARGQARRIGLGVLVLAVTTALLGEPVAPLPRHEFLTTGLRCVACVALFGALPWIALFRAVGRAAPFEGTTAGLCVGAAAFLTGAAAVRVACPIDDVLHLALWHGLPVALWTAVSAIAGTVWLGRGLADGAPDRRAT